MENLKTPVLTSATDLFGKSYQLVSKNLSIFIIIFSAQALFTLWNILDWFSADPSATATTSDGIWAGLSAVIGLHTVPPSGAAIGFLAALMVVAVVLALMQPILVLRAAKGESPTLKHLWDEFKQKGLRLLALQILAAAAIVVGFILLIVPGIIMIWRLFLAPYILIDKNTSIKQAISRSWSMSRGYFSPIWAVILVMILFGLIGFIPVAGVAAGFLLGVAYSVAPALRYLEIKKL